jgi:hypothetical protein
MVHLPFGDVKTINPDELVADLNKLGRSSQCRLPFLIFAQQFFIDFIFRLGSGATASLSNDINVIRLTHAAKLTVPLNIFFHFILHTLRCNKPEHRPRFLFTSCQTRAINMPIFSAISHATLRVGYEELVSFK